MAVLELRPNCECCNVDLPPAADAFICTYECTFCRDCAQGILAGYCPNCLGNLQPRPIRPLGGPAGGLHSHPASTKRVVRPGGCTETPDPSRSSEIRSG